jgi:hypothetical protein
MSPRNRAAVLVAISTGVLSLDEVLSLAASGVGEDLRSLSLRDVLENLPGVDAAAVIAGLRKSGYPTAARARLGDILDARGLSLLIDAMCIVDRNTTVGNWPFVERTRQLGTIGLSRRAQND